MPLGNNDATVQRSQSATVVARLAVAPQSGSANPLRLVRKNPSSPMIPSSPAPP